MNTILFKSMSSYLFKSSVAVFMVINLCFSLPVTKTTPTLYSSFMNDLQSNQCTLPSSIVVRNFPNKTVESSLQVCNNNEYLKYNKEVAILCTETFDLFKTLFCPPDNSRFDKVEFTFSKYLCKDLSKYAAVLPEGPLKHLLDPYTCSLLCSEDVEEACQVLWSSLLLTESKGSSTSKEPVISDNTAAAEKSNVERNDASNDSQLPISSVNQVPELKDSETKPNDLAITKETKKITQELKINQNITQNNINQDLNKSTGHPNGLSEVEAYSVSKAIAEQLSVTTNNKLVTSGNSLNLKTSQPATDPQNSNSDSLDLKKPLPPSNQPSDLARTPSFDAKTPESITILPAQKLSQEPIEKPKEKGQEVINEEVLKKESDPFVVAEGSPDDTISQTVPTTEVKEEESKDAIHTPEDKSNKPKPDQLMVVSESSISSEPSVISVPAQKDSSIPSVSPTPSLEKMEDEIPMPKDTDQYTDLENGDGDLDGEYSKQEYGDNGMYEPSKSKVSVSESPKTVIVPKEPVVSQRDELLDFNRNPLNPARDSFGRGSEEIQVLATFPSQEDGHFFFYLLTIVLIFMAGYLVFHNKQKIIALIVEGRHERRRRSHGLGYRKLETK